MSREDESNQFFRAASDEGLRNWLANADKSHPQYQRALLEKERREKERDHEIAERRHRESNWGKKILVGVGIASPLIALAGLLLAFHILRPIDQPAKLGEASPTPSQTTQAPIAAASASPSTSTASPQPKATESPLAPASSPQMP